MNSVDVSGKPALLDGPPQVFEVRANDSMYHEDLQQPLHRRRILIGIVMLALGAMVLLVLFPPDLLYLVGGVILMVMGGSLLAVTWSLRQSQGLVSVAVSQTGLGLSWMGPFLELRWDRGPWTVRLIDYTPSAPRKFSRVPCVLRVRYGKVDVMGGVSVEVRDAILKAAAAAGLEASLTKLPTCAITMIERVG